MEDSTCQWPECGETLTNGRRGRPRRWCVTHRVAVKRERNRKYSPDSTTRRCSVDGCDRFVRAQDLCSTHYNREVFYRGGRLTEDERRTRNGDPTRRSKALREKSLLRKSVMTAHDADQITREALGDRDGWVCGICKALIDPTLEYPDLMSATIDHIVPIAHGGRHRWSNVQISHFACNMTKGDAEVPRKAAA